MRISDEKRREVAQELRACAQDVNGTLDFAMYLSNWVGIEGVTDDGGNHFSGAADRRCAERTLEKLADLIDRPTCNDVGDDWEFHCSACGCELDILEMEVGEPTMWKDGAAQVPKYCPSCGAEVVTTSD